MQQIEIVITLIRKKDRQPGVVVDLIRHHRSPSPPHHTHAQHPRNSLLSFSFVFRAHTHTVFVAHSSSPSALSYAIVSLVVAIAPRLRARGAPNFAEARLCAMVVGFHGMVTA